MNSSASTLKSIYHNQWQKFILYPKKRYVIFRQRKIRHIIFVRELVDASCLKKYSEEGL